MRSKRLSRKNKKRQKRNTRRRRRQRGGDGSTAIPDKYPGMLVYGKPPSDDYDDPDAVPNVMRQS